jgi:hypothetical protein
MNVFIPDRQAFFNKCPLAVIKLQVVPIELPPIIEKIIIKNPKNLHLLD